MHLDADGKRAQFFEGICQLNLSAVHVESFGRQPGFQILRGDGPEQLVILSGLDRKRERDVGQFRRQFLDVVFDFLRLMGRYSLGMLQRPHVARVGLQGLLTGE